MGKIAVVSEPVDAYIGGFMSIFRCPSPIDMKILEYNLLSARFRQLVAKAKEQNINNLTEEKLRPFSLRIPVDLETFMGEVAQYESGGVVTALPQAPVLGSFPATWAGDASMVTEERSTYRTNKQKGKKRPDRSRGTR